MMIREPLVHATYYYLRQTPGDSLSRQQDRHETFAADVHRLLHTLSGWLAIAAPETPVIRFWEDNPPREAQPLMPACAIEGPTNASAQLGAYALRNMLLLRVSVARRGEHEQTMWSLLEEVLGQPPTAPSWLHTVRYWCGVAPRVPEDLETHRSMVVRTSFGVLCLGTEANAHLLVYPDARTEARADVFLQSLAMQLDWFPVQARYCLNRYVDRAAGLMQSQQHALEQAARSAQWWTFPGQPASLRSLEPLRSEIDTLETSYREALSDLYTTQSAVHEVRALTSNYRLALMQSGLWEAAPTVWDAQVAAIGEIQSEIERNADYISQTLQQMDTTLRLIQTRTNLLQTERERLLIYLVTLIGLAGLVVLIVDTSPAQMAVRLLALGIAVGLIWGLWRFGQRRRAP
ncbi:MAG: hypothetical protein HY866_21155 [Chloroflexi bacterium]|nr:hypothetical protein [Chloroflexota bacterium]